MSHQRSRLAFESKPGTSHATASVGVTHVTLLRSLWNTVHTAWLRLSVVSLRQPKTDVECPGVAGSGSGSHGDSGQGHR